MRLNAAESLPAGAIIGAAESDLRSAAHNRSPALAPPYLQYAFHRKHVRGAKSAAELIERALNELKLGASSSKRNTARLYSDEAALRAALAKARSADA